MLQIALLIVVLIVLWFALPFAYRRLSEARLCRARKAIVLSSHIIKFTQESGGRMMRLENGL